MHLHYWQQFGIMKQVSKSVWFVSMQRCVRSSTPSLSGGSARRHRSHLTSLLYDPTGDFPPWNSCTSALTAAHSNSATTWPSLIAAAGATLERGKDGCAAAVTKELIHTEVPAVVALHQQCYSLQRGVGLFSSAAVDLD